MSKSFKDCAAAVDLSDELEAYLRGEGEMGDTDTFRRALEAKRHEAMIKKYQANLQAIRLNEITARVDADVERTGRNYAAAARAIYTVDDRRQGGSGLEQYMQAAVNYDMAQLKAMLTRSQMNDGPLARLKSTGGLSDPELGRNVLRELFKRGSTGDNDARAIADIFANLSEKQRQRFNHYGGDIKKLESWNAPQKHDASLLLQGGRTGRSGRPLLKKVAGIKASPDDAMDRWVEFITPLIRPFEENGMPVSNEQTREILESSYQAIVTNGASRREPDSVANATNLANRHQESRAFHFLDSDAWLRYGDEYGADNPLDSIVEHTISMARDTAVLKTLGPRPQAVHNALRANAAASDANQPLKMNRGVSNLDNTWMNVTGLGREGNDMLASAGAVTRGVASLAKLGGATVSAITDPAIGASSILFNGTGVGRYAMNIVKQLTPGLSRAGTERAKALGYIQDVVVDEFMGVQRFADPELTGVVQRLNTRMYKASLLTPWDRAQRTAYKLSFVDGASKQLDAPNERLAYAFKRAGITEADRAALAQARNPEHGGLIDMKQLDFELAIKWSGLVETEIAGGVITPTARTHALLNQGQQVGTVAGESMRMMTQWKSHPIAYSQTAIARVANTMLGRHAEIGVPMRFWYPMVSTISLSAMGALAIQSREVSKGRSPLEVDWKLALLGGVQGGAGGLWYESAFGVLMNGRSPFSLLSPAALTMFDDILGTGILGNVDDEGMAALDDQLVEYLGGATVRAMGWVPGQSLWYLRSTYEQVVLRMVAAEISEDELRKMDNRAARRESETGQTQSTWIGGSIGELFE